eukprot:303535_1
MGSTMTKLKLKNEKKLIMTGLDCAGKTTLLYKFCKQKLLGKLKPVQTIPTIGFSVENMQFENFDITCWDSGGSEKIRPLWKHYYKNTNCLIWVIDSNDRKRILYENNLEYAKYSSYNELHRLVSEPEFKNCIVLILANKNDIKTAMNVNEIAEIMELNTIKQQWLIYSVSVVNDAGILEAINWMKFKLDSNESKWLANNQNNEYIKWINSNSKEFMLKMENKKKTVLLICYFVREILIMYKLKVTSDIAKLLHQFYQDRNCEYDKIYGFYV